MRNLLLYVIFLAAEGSCEQRRPDFVRTIGSPSGTSTATFSGFQPRGTIDGYLTISLAQPDAANEPQLTFGHMLNVRIGWLDDHKLALVYDILEPRHAESPVYMTGEADSAVEIITCNTRYLDCASLLSRLPPKHTIVFKEFPEGGWSHWVDQNGRFTGNYNP